MTFFRIVDKLPPFVDRPLESVGVLPVVSVVTASSDGIDTTEINKFRQGININTVQIFRESLVPLCTPNGIPKTGDKFDFSLIKLNYGREILFRDTVNGKDILPYDDIAGRWNAASYLSDPGTQMYPEVEISPNFLDPAMMNGVIEPLTIRHKLPNVLTEGPFVAHDTRAAMMPSNEKQMLARYIPIKPFLPFRESIDAPYYDSQDTAIDMTGIPAGTVPLDVPGISYPELPPGDPFYDTDPTTLDFHGYELSNDTGFADNKTIGMIGKSADTGFTSRDYTNKSSDASGVKRVNNLDSTTFRGRYR